VAALEAFEEAGVRGEIGTDEIGSFTYQKRIPPGGRLLVSYGYFRFV